MQKFIIWVKINWLKILLLFIFILFAIGVSMFVSYIVKSFGSLEGFSKRQQAGMMAMYMPMMIIAQLLTLPFVFAMYYYIMRGGGIGGIKKNKINKDGLNVYWTDIIGMNEAKADAREVVKLLKDHALQTAVGGNIIKGALMIGPPGCGKTYLAKAMATECGLPMISAVGSDFVAMFMGQGAAKMKSLFKQARAEAKIHGGCIVFIDEIDAFARARVQGGDRPGGFGGSDTSYNATINQFLQEFDGLRQKENNIIILGATNVNEEELDEAIMRSGRFDRKIRVEKPNEAERVKILEYYSSKINVDKNIDLEYVAKKTKWFSPSDLSNVVKESGVFAARENRTLVTKKDMDAAVDRIMISIEKMGGDKILSDKVNVKWDDVIGMKDVKEEAWEVVKMLKDRNMVKAVGGKIIKGVLMFGPPGCGKTYLAKAMATESGFPFISVTGSEFQTMWIGEGAKKIRKVFAEARKMAKAEGGCIVFIDEIDSFAGPRQNVSDFGGSKNHSLSVNQFLTELDGLRQQENTIMVLGATNVSEKDIDPAILRAGRMERKIHFSLPTIEERKELFEFYFKNVRIAEDVDADRWSKIAVGVSPSDIDNIIREAGLMTLRDNRGTITHKDMMDAYDRITIGAVSRTKYRQEDILKTAYHEAGHAILTFLVSPSKEVIKATVKPRKGFLGYIWDRDIEELAANSPSYDQWLSEIQVLFAGHAAECVQYGHGTSGHAGSPGSDFYRAMRIAHLLVWRLSYGKSGLIGDFDAHKLPSGEYNISEQTKIILEQDVQDIMKTCLDKTLDILRKHKDLLDDFAHQLAEKGDLEYYDVQAIFDKFNLKPLNRSTEPR